MSLDAVRAEVSSAMDAVTQQREILNAVVREIQSAHATITRVTEGSRSPAAEVFTARSAAVVLALMDAQDRVEVVLAAAEDWLSGL